MAKKKGVLAAARPSKPKATQAKKAKTAPKRSTTQATPKTKKPTLKTTAKNVSKRYPNGRTLQTRDEYFFEEGNYRKPGYEKKGNYRKVVIVDSNRNDELAVVKLTTSKRGKNIPGQTKSKYRPFVETKDENGDPIKAGKKFIENPASKDLSKHAVAQIKKDAFKDSAHALKNKGKARKMKGRFVKK